MHARVTGVWQSDFRSSLLPRAATDSHTVGRAQRCCIPLDLPPFHPRPLAEAGLHLGHEWRSLRALTVKISCGVPPCLLSQHGMAALTWPLVSPAHHSVHAQRAQPPRLCRASLHTAGAARPLTHPLPREPGQRNSDTGAQPPALPMDSAAAVPEVALRAQALLQAALVAAHAHRDALLGGLALLLVLATARLLLGIARFVHTYYLRPAINPRTFGPWAVVTGASDGIGRALSNLLAEKGESAAPCLRWWAAAGRHAHASWRSLQPLALPALPPQGVNIVLVSLPEPRLHEAAAELEAKYGVKTRTVPVDLCRNVGPATFAAISAAMEGIEASRAPSHVHCGACTVVGAAWCQPTVPPCRQRLYISTPSRSPPNPVQVGILVNNAGLYQPPAFLEELSEQRIQDMLTINSLVPTMVSTAPGRREPGLAAAAVGCHNEHHNREPCPGCSCAKWCCRACGNGGAASSSTSAARPPASCRRRRCCKVGWAAGVGQQGLGKHVCSSSKATEWHPARPDKQCQPASCPVLPPVGAPHVFHPSPLFCCTGYAATKAYLDNLSRSLDAEYSPYGVRVQCIWAAFVATRMTPNLKWAAGLGLQTCVRCTRLAACSLALAHCVSLQALLQALGYVPWPRRLGGCCHASDRAGNHNRPLPSACHGHGAVAAGWTIQHVHCCKRDAHLLMHRLYKLEAGSVHNTCTSSVPCRTLASS